MEASYKSFRHKFPIIPLRESGELVEPISAPLNSELEPPRALKSLAKIIDGDLCHRCGTCVGICPTSVLGLDENEYPVVNNLSACTDCDLCVKVCPGDELNVFDIAKKVFGKVPDIKDMHGHFEKSYLSYSNDKKIREMSTSGGLITALLIYLLESKQIDGAIVIASDSEQLWKGVPIIAKTKDDLISATKSKYAIAPTNVMLSEIRKQEGKFALVGLPCQIHGFHKAAELDRRIKDRVVITIGLFCHAAIDHEPMRYIWSNLVSKNVKKVSDEKVTGFISRIGKHPGTPHVKLKDGTLMPVYFPEKKNYRPNSMEIMNILYRLYTPPRCLTCYDSTSEFADIAVGDPWMAPPSNEIKFNEGYSFVLSRTKTAEKFLRLAQKDGAISLTTLVPKAARKSNTMMGVEKRWRAFRVLETRRRQGFPTPNYGFKTPKLNGWHFIKTELNMLSHAFCFIKKGKLAILRLTFSPLGYSLLWLNHKRRIFRDWRKNLKANVQRNVFGKKSIIED